MVEQRTLTPLVLVRVQVSQPLQKPLIFNGFFSLKFAFRPVLLYKRLVDTLKTENEMAFFKKKKQRPARFDQRQPDDVQAGLADVRRAEMETAGAVDRFNAGRVQFRRAAGQSAETRFRRGLSG